MSLNRVKPKPSESQENICLISADSIYQRLLSRVLKEKSRDTVMRIFPSASSFFSHPYPEPQIIIFDLSLLDMEGETFVRRAKALFDTCEIIAISSREDLEAAVPLLSLGVFTHLVKDKFLRETLLHAVEQVKKVNVQQVFAYH